MSGKSAKAARRSEVKDDSQKWRQLDIEMLLEDANWLNSISRSAKQDEAWLAVTGLVTLPHMARIAYEGLALLKAQRPEQALGVEVKYPSEVAAARHAVKLLDDNQKLFAGVVRDFEEVEKSHVSSFQDNASFAIASRDGRIYSTSRVLAFNAHLETVLVDSTGSRSAHYDFAESVGEVIATVVKRFGHGVPAPINLDLPIGEAPEVRPRQRDEFYANRYEPEIPNSVKDVLTLVESSINAALTVFESSSLEFPRPVFRIRFLTAVHSINSLQEVANAYPRLADRSGVERLTAVLNSAEAVRLVGNRQLRNRSMHYGVPSRLEGLSIDLPDYGLVTATSPESTYDQVAADLGTILRKLSDALSSWK